MFVSEILQQYSHKSKKDTKDTIALKEGTVKINKKRVFLFYFMYTTSINHIQHSYWSDGLNNSPYKYLMS